MVLISDIYELRPGEIQDEYLYRLGCLKEAGTIQSTWPELSSIFNSVLRPHLPPWDDSSWRKRFRRLQQNPPVHRELDPDELPYDPPEQLPELKDGGIKAYLAEAQRERALIQDIRTDQNRVMRRAARAVNVAEIFREEIKRFDPPKRKAAPEEAPTQRALYALLSDVHYGIAFMSRAGTYDPSVASSRVLHYAQKLINIGFSENINTIYVSLLGDMMSGIIHQTIRLENRENIVRQVVGASELVSEFLRMLAESFRHVYVNSVPGNHSRVDPSFSDALRGEKLDNLIPWYCATKLEHFSNVVFVENALDNTIGLFDIFGNTYVSVHGDMDPDLKASAQRIEYLLGRHVDTIVAGHTHIFDARMEHTNYIHNGSVCGSGDEYTMKKRLYGPPVQVCMVVSSSGVESVLPIPLSAHVAGDAVADFEPIKIKHGEHAWVC